MAMYSSKIEQAMSCCIDDWAMISAAHQSSAIATTLHYTLHYTDIYHSLSDLFGYLTDELGGADEALALASYANGTTVALSSYGASGSGIGKHAANPLLKRSRLYYEQRKEGAIVGLDNQSASCKFGG